MTEHTRKPAPRQLLPVNWEEGEGFELVIEVRPPASSRFLDSFPPALSSTDTGFLPAPPPQP